MRSTLKLVAVGAALVGTTMFMTAKVVSQDQGEYDQEAMQKMMEAWMTPGPEHHKMEAQAGKWKSKTTQWDHEAPSAEPTTHMHRMDLQSILGGRFMVEKVQGKMTMEGKDVDFEGFGIFGYDNMRQKHFFIWMDNFGTGYMVGEGEADATGDVITYLSEMEWGGQTMKFKSVSRTISDDESTFEMFVETPDGWWKNLEIHNERVKGY